MLTKHKVPNVKPLAARGFKLTHVVYFGAVFIEAHGVYAYAGGALLLFTVVDYVFHLHIGED